LLLAAAAVVAHIPTLAFLPFSVQAVVQVVIAQQRGFP
jgi:hypothetical protein